MNYLRHVVSLEEIKVDMTKTRTVQEWKEPTSQHDIRSFLSLVSRYR